MVKVIRFGLAALLLVVLMLLAGTSVARWGVSALGVPAFSSPAPAATGSTVAASVGGTQAGETADLSASAQLSQQQQAGVTDARPAIRKTGKAVVTVISRAGGSRSGGFAGPTASGSGVIIDAQGHIVTNQHVVQGSSSFDVIFSDGKRVQATLVGADAFSDLAVLKVAPPVPAVAAFGDSDKLEQGQPVVAIGSALGDFRNTVTVGVVSGLNRDLDQSGSSALRDLIQTDAAINHGNSGGPLIDLSGNVIGINVAVVRGGFGGDVAEGLGFAIPSNIAREVSAQIIRNGSVSRPYLGISYLAISPQIAAYYGLARQQGVLVREVVAGGPAARAGIQANSIITKFDGTVLNEENSMLELLMKRKVGDSVKLTLLPPEGGAEKEVTVVLGSRPSGQ